MNIINIRVTNHVFTYLVTVADMSLINTLRRMSTLKHGAIAKRRSPVVGHC